MAFPVGIAYRPHFHTFREPALNKCLPFPLAATLPHPFKDAFGLKPVDVVADLTTTELVKKALTPGRLSGSGLQVTPSRSSRSSLAKTLSPSQRASVVTPVVGADMTGCGEKSGASCSAPLLKSPQIPASRAGFEPSAAAREREGEGGNTPGEAINVAGVDSPHRGSWSRPIGPRPQPSRGSSAESGGSGCGVKSGEINGIGGGDDRGCVLMKSRAWPSNRSQRQVAVLATENVVGLEAQLPGESIANGAETGAVVEGRSLVEGSDNSRVKGRRPMAGGSGDGGASQNGRSRCGSSSKNIGVVHPREHEVVLST